jgi:hypothetical protein
MAVVHMERHEPDRRPLIRIETGAYTRLAELSDEAILRAGLPVYVGAAGLVYPAIREVETAEGLSATMTQLVPVTVPVNGFRPSRRKTSRSS